MSAFDGAGKPYKGPSFRGGLAFLVVSLVAVAVIWLAFSGALNTEFGAEVDAAPTVEER